MKVKFLKEHKDSILPERKRKQDAGIDVYAYEDVTINPNERKLVPIGVKIIIPEGYYYTFAPRSGHAFKHNVIPSHYNVMDSNYTGDCSVLMLNRSDEPFTIKKGERFCQILIHKIPDIELEEIDLEEFKKEEEKRSERKSSGFGSSGKK